MTADNRERDGLNDEATGGLRRLAGLLLVALVAMVALANDPLALLLAVERSKLAGPPALHGRD